MAIKAQQSARLLHYWNVDRGLCLQYTKDYTQAMKSEFMLMAEAFATYLPPVYPYDVIGGQRQIKQMDF